MREPRPISITVAQCHRITPAHAGTTNMSEDLPHARQDHPRSCGNHVLFPSLSHSAIGSPPLMREPRAVRRFSIAAFRITSAHAGTTFRSSMKNLNLGDHPRSCGNHPNVLKQNLMFKGSPPLMREPLTWIASCLSSFRITPAHAGTTLPSLT